MPATEPHRSAAELEAFVLGTLADTAEQAVEAHLSHCTDCQRRAAAVAGDTLVDLLRAARTRVGPRGDTPPTAAETQLWDAPAEPSTTPFPAELLHHPRYRLLRPLGVGGMGTVWLAEHTVLNRPVALKLIRPEFLDKPGALERFRREAQAVARLRHPNIVAAHDADQAGSTHFLVMEYVDGVSLAEHLRQSGPLPVAEACRMIRDAALGLQHAHEHGLVHRDIKPHNLMLAADGTVKILDFGLATLASEIGKSGLTGANVVVGTPDYIAPEQAENARAADIRSDLYSLGCTFYHLLTGRVPFPGDSTLRKLDDQRNRDPEPVRKRRPEVPPALAAVVAKMMAKDPAARFQTPAEVARALEPFVNPAAPRRRRRTWVAVAAALLFVGIVAAAVVYRIQTDVGELVITSESDRVKVIVKHDGKEVQIVNPETNGSIKLNLRPGEYELELKGNVDGLRLDLNKATLVRGGKVEVKVAFAAGLVEPLHRIRWGDGSEFAPVDISPDGRLGLLARVTESGEQSVRIYDLESGNEVRKLDGAWGRFSPSGDKVITAGLPEWKVFLVHDLATGKLIRQFDVGSSNWNDFSLPGTGTQLLLYGEADAQIWDWAKGERVRTLFPWTGEGDCINLTLDGRYVLHQPEGKGPLRAIEVATGKETDQYPHLRDLPLMIGLHGFSQDGRRVVCHADRGVKVFDVATGKEVAAVEIGKDSEGVLSGNGERLLTDSKVRDEMWLWDVASGKLMQRLHFPEFIDLSATNARLSRDGRYAVVAGPTDSAYVFRLADPGRR